MLAHVTPGRVTALAASRAGAAVPPTRAVARRARPGTDAAWPYALLLLFLLLLLSSAAVLFPSLAPLAPAQWVGTAAIVLLALQAGARRRPLRLGWPETHLLVALVGVAAVSSFTAFWMPFALAHTLLLVKFLAIYLLIVNTVVSEGRLRTVFRVLALGGLFPALGSLRYHHLGQVVEGGRSAWIGIFGNPNDLAYALAVLFPVVLVLALDAGGWARAALLGCAGVYAVSLYLTYSRGGLLAFGLVLVLAMVRFGTPPAALMMLVLLLAGIGLAPATAGWGRSATFAGLSDDDTVKQRLETMRMGLAMWADRPLLGVGPGCSVIGWVDYVEFPPVSTKWLHSHNTGIQLLSELGLAGAGAFGLAVAASLAKAQRTRRRAPGTFPARASAGLEISLWGFVAAGLSGGLLFTWFPYIVMGLISAAALLRAGEAPAAGGARGGPS